jgi:hypothetical protein
MWHMLSAAADAAHLQAIPACLCQQWLSIGCLGQAAATEHLNGDTDWPRTRRCAPRTGVSQKQDVTSFSTSPIFMHNRHVCVYGATHTLLGRCRMLAMFVHSMQVLRVSGQLIELCDFQDELQHLHCGRTLCGLSRNAM